MFRKVLIANRGEIAVRVIRALREMGIGSVAVYSDADRAALHVRMADEAARLGPAPSSESYLQIERILEAARCHGADAVHPGYGFLAENAGFAQSCAEAGLVFIGPSADSIRRMGSKTEARRLVKAQGVPVVPGAERSVADLAEARAIAGTCGYPVMLKAAAGGGGKGMRRVDRPQDLEAALRDASSESERAFRSSEVYIEKLIENPRHIEIQVLGDLHGNLVHLGERECSIQRRHQKVIEECPSPLVAAHPEMRAAMGEAAVRAARAAGYYNAGTIEFLVDAHRNFYFLEMNTRLQVEHPVTELVTGLDLVKLQIRVASGEPLPFRQPDLAWRGASLECRVYAEDPDHNFFPSPGRITHLARPSGPGVRLDSGVYEGFTVPIDYDPLLAKLAVWAESRQEAIARMIRALEEYSVGGIKTNLSFFRRILEDREFRAGRLHTGFIEEFLERSEPLDEDAGLEAVAALVAALHLRSHREPNTGARVSPAPWLTEGRERLLR
ncbi:MAG: acetyl-CoA carboxylase biotin carboxylase subunit [Candidatus Solibacter usitatus]|nr:acetyl-CoA carboxylase biotin carboxylase subunit [Candidatus Solibacter usitatus]